MANTAADVLAKARADIGYSRWSDPERGTKFGRWYASDHGSYYGENGVPYCGMAVSYWFAMAGATCPGLPGAYTPTMASAGRKAKREVARNSARAGDVAYFDWELDGLIDHVGIVESYDGTYLHTIEGNTGNGQVLRRTRAMGTVVCLIRPTYSGSSSSTPTPSPSTGSGGSDLVRTAQRYLQGWGYDIGRYGVDGVYGSDSRSAAIRYAQFNMNYYGAGISVDGVLGQKTISAWGRLGPVYKGFTRTYLVKAVQIALMLNGQSVGSYGIDGVCGDGTRDAILRFQRLKGLTQDGVAGTDTLRKLLG